MWREIKDYIDLYEISTESQVYSLPKTGSGGHSGTILKGRFDRQGYHLVSLYKENKRTTFKVHRLVAEAFLPNPNNLPQINHIDHNPKNNIIENLEWVSSKDNMRWCWDNGRGKNPLHKKLGQYSPNSKLTEEQAKEIIKLRHAGEKLIIIAKKFNIGHTQVSAIYTGVSWKCLDSYRKIVKEGANV